MSENITLYLAIIGSVLGSVGSILGIVNFIRDLDKTRVKLKIFPKIGIFLEDDSKIIERLCIEIINLSGFPVNIKDAGFVLRNPKGSKFFSLRPDVLYGGKLPYKVESRASITVFDKNNPLIDTIKNVIAAYAVTECGIEIRGKNKNWEALIKGSSRNSEQGAVANS